MYTVTKYPHGTFSWADLSSTDAAKSKAFYTELMGWTTSDIPIGEGMVYTMFKKDGCDVAAMSQMMPDMQQQGVPSFWSNYVTVDDVDAMAEKVKALGGSVLVEPFDVFDSGRMLVLQDPTGASLSLWQARNHIGAGLVNTVGAMCWNELSTRDAAKAQDFYTKLFGWEFTKDPAQEFYHYFTNNGRANGGIMQMDERWGDAPPHWMVYFTVADIDQTVAKVPGLGGKVHVPVTPAGTIGRFSVVGDPTGAVCTFIQLTEPEIWIEHK
jgi:hypothetical protein